MPAPARHEFGALRAGLETALGEPGAATPEVLGALRRLSDAVRAAARRAGLEALLSASEPGDPDSPERPDLPQRHEPELQAFDVRDDARRLLRALQTYVREPDDRVLLVSDDVLLAELLQRQGRRIERTVDPVHAHARLASGELSALVLDLDVPAWDARDLLVGLHDLDERGAPVTLVLSSRGDLLTRTECTALGATFLRKPHPPGLVEATLEAALLRTRLAG